MSHLRPEKKNRVGSDVEIIADGSAFSLRPNVTSAMERLTNADPGDIQEIAASQIQLLSGYYDLVLGQARRSFRWALIAAGIGLGFFFAAMAFLLVNGLTNLATVSVISGALIEVIAAINFFLYGKTSAQLEVFHTRLDITQRLLLANSICDSLKDETRDQTRSELVRSIIGDAGNQFNHRTAPLTAPEGQ